MNDFSINDRNNTLLKALIALRDDPSARPPSGGICYGVTVLASREKHIHDWPNETVGVVRQLLSLMMRDWPDRVEGDACYPINGHCVSFSREDREGKIWENPLRFQLLDWLIDELTCNEPVYDFYKDKAAGILWDNPRRIELLDWLIEGRKTMTPEQKLLIAALENIDTSKGTDGICRQVRMYVAPEGHYNTAALKAVELMDKLMQEWPESSNDLLYPVPNPRGLLKSTPYNTFRHHCDRGTLWAGEYGEKRKELVAWMLEQLRK